jgi:DNA mismatch endonuclease (patch repair protein)
MIIHGISRRQRSRMMASVRKKNTKPEMIVRRFLHRYGLRFTLHDPKLPGTPDLVFPARRTVLFVHGCFWHRCPHCSVGAQKVCSNPDYWLPKLERNQARDAKAQSDLVDAGWKVLVIWECQISDSRVLTKIGKTVKRRPSKRINCKFNDLPTSRLAPTDHRFLDRSG